MEIGKDISSEFKAKNFLGFMSIRNGVVVVAFSQLLFGVALYCILHYLHPSLTGVAVFLVSLHVLVSVLGLIGAFKRNLGFHAAYMVFYALSLGLVTMVTLDMSELVHFLPKAPTIKDLSLLAAAPPLITRFKSFNPRVLFPYNFFKEAFLPDEFARRTPAVLVGPHPATPGPSMQAISLHFHKAMAAQPMMHAATSAVDDVPVDANQPNGTMDPSAINDLSDLKNALREKLQEAAAPQAASPASTAAETPAASAAAPQAQPAAPAAPEAKSDSLYDSLPFLPHPGETEGESEEVSSDEFPPETKGLTPEAKSEVVVMYKMQKRSVKFAAAAFLGLSLLFYLYGYWIALTFAVNKCTCLDELSAQPDQFSPLID